MAAKEIKALTNEASIKVEQGAVLVEQSGALFEEIVVAIRKVDGMIYEIRCAAGRA